ncbi:MULTISPECIES: DNA repair protein RecN [Dehalobacter]|jgi:DNA repair protein RecN (Recombination protein N)|uniref:DNA repair protein RecN n=1 Tax=Dehalobacter restrictus TaxID=55583 RepID=A0A857DGH3_9FIRM|nr:MULTISPECIES: DNA repair protein RecN [Dehalobacter]MCG1026096.1 DNA repair protein RecN [Dehalobacter sp.]MDJ0305023.1 DNA repair protein RecN [Dehalobacter sp.]OCZ53432.1 DNA repair protein RecN [Dehalobacter sp. TeCB1]QHA00394.1 DNA repair protein RecN [Dehalobacter restrictus]
MLVELRIKDFALMEDVHLVFDKGLSVFTGETGAGKSMLVDALGLLLGGRASNEFLRHGKDKACVEGIFSNLPLKLTEMLQDEGYPLEDDLLFLYREINDSGRNVCRVQGRTVPLSLYRTFCEGLVDIHDQMEHQSLLQAETQRELLDSFGGEEHLKLLKQVRDAAVNYRNTMSRERELLRSERDREKREEILRYQIEEIDRIAPVSGEEESLEQEKKFLLNAEKIVSLVNEAYDELYAGTKEASDSAFDMIGSATEKMGELSALDPEIEELHKNLEEIYFSLEDYVTKLRSYKDKLDFEPGRLDGIETRLIDLGKLRKYAYTIEAVLERRVEMEEELEEITHLQDEKENIRREKKEALTTYNNLAEELSLNRGIQAERIEKGLADELLDLGLNEARIEIIFSPVTEPSPEGAEQIEFYFSANVGEPPKPLAKVASGGEMARIMLAFKSLLSKVETVDTFVFDEVDSGVGGRTIMKVAEKLEKISENRQVLCITHSAPIAAFADSHFGIDKVVVEDRTQTKVNRLGESERVQEMARMLGGERVALSLAEELWQQAKK